MFLKVIKQPPRVLYKDEGNGCIEFMIETDAFDSTLKPYLCIRENDQYRRLDDALISRFKMTTEDKRFVTITFKINKVSKYNDAKPYIIGFEKFDKTTNQTIDFHRYAGPVEVKSKRKKYQRMQAAQAQAAQAISQSTEDSVSIIAKRRRLSEDYDADYEEDDESTVVDLPKYVPRKKETKFEMTKKEIQSLKNEIHEIKQTLDNVLKSMTILQDIQRKQFISDYKHLEFNSVNQKIIDMEAYFDEL